MIIFVDIKSFAVKVAGEKNFNTILINFNNLYSHILFYFPLHKIAKNIYIQVCLNDLKLNGHKNADV